LEFLENSQEVVVDAHSILSPGAGRYPGGGERFGVGAIYLQPLLMSAAPQEKLRVILLKSGEDSNMNPGRRLC
jgi:hypothetical protein